MPYIIEYQGKRPTIADNAFIAENAVIIGDVTIGEDVDRRMRDRLEHPIGDRLPVLVHVQVDGDDHDVEFFENPIYLKLLLKSVQISGLVTLATVLLAYPAAYFIASSLGRVPTRSIAA